MKYVLVVITHGESRGLSDTLTSFARYISPAPRRTDIFRDPGNLGFCGNVRRAWNDPAVSDHEYVFWLEHDFHFVRHVDLEDLALVLDQNPRLTQMSLMRDPVNEEERAVGSLYKRHLGSWIERGGWLEHFICHTTNPSLMRSSFMQANPWPEYASQCEGRFSADLRDRGYSFATWGEGETYVMHTGALRTGHSY